MLRDEATSPVAFDSPVEAEPQQVKLPFALDVPIRSYLDYAFPLSIVAADPHHRSALFGSFIQLFFPDEKLEYDRVLMLPSLRTGDWEQLGFLRTLVVETDAPALNRREVLEELLVEHLRQGHYADVHIDEYFLPGRPCYRSVHSVHDNLILGCDVGKRTFQLAGYGRDYEVAPMRFEDIWNAFHHMPWRQRKRRRLRMVWRRPVAKETFDLATAVAQLEDYVESRPTVSPHDMRSAQLYWRARRFTGAWGLDTYAAFSEYVTRIAREGKLLDLRATRTLWEHKACMLARLKYLESRRDLPAAALFARSYAPVETLAKAVRFASYEYNASGRDRRHTDAIADALRRMRESETAVLHAVVASLS